MEAFKVLPDGDLEAVNKQWIGGMRGCYVEVDDENRYLFVGGHHDGRVTMMHLEKMEASELSQMVFPYRYGARKRQTYQHTTC